MFADTSKPPQPLPTSELQKVQPGISLLAPLSRRGHGPGLIVLTAASKDQMSIVKGVPSPLIKWAEEGYTVAQVDASAFERLSGDEIVNAALLALEVCDRCEPKGKVGLVGSSPTKFLRRGKPCLTMPTSIRSAALEQDSTGIG